MEKVKNLNNFIFLKLYFSRWKMYKKDLEKDKHRKRNICKQIDKHVKNEIMLERKEAMTINPFFVIFNKLVLEISKRLEANNELDTLFNFLSNLLFNYLKL